MKFCTFGTVRIDLHIFDELKSFNTYDEVKLNEISMMLGGSVYYTSSVLNELDCDVVMYMLNISDDFSDFVKLRLSQQNINYITSKRDKNQTAATLIFVDKEGGKKMMSYDGSRNDSNVLKKLVADVSQYDIFYTSYYEINRQNFLTIASIMDNSKLNFLDLSPLLYEVDVDIVKETISNADILSGTTEEYDILLKKLELTDIHALFEKYNFKFLFEKQGKDGATLLTSREKYHYSPKVIKTSRDTTGCGDTFNAGVIYGISQGWSEKNILEYAVNIATEVAYSGFDLDLIKKYALASKETIRNFV